jgi:hypothetical protein
MIRIPKNFSLMNLDFVVRHTTDAEQSAFDDPEEPFIGLCHEGEILLGAHRKRETFEHTYFHELAHGLFDAIGRPDLSADEALVDAIGGALHQYEKTRTGNLPMNRRKKQNGNSQRRRDERLVDRRHLRGSGSKRGKG